MSDPRIQLRDPWLALILAFVLPGLGHLYQKRYLKSGIFFVCVMGLFCWGMGIAEGKAVYYRPMKGELAGQRKEFIGYLAQVGIGVPALPAIYQHMRFYAPENQGRGSLLEPIDATFTGVIDVDRPGRSETAAVKGRIQLKPGRDRFDNRDVLVGEFVGTTDVGEDLTLTLGDETQVGLKVDASPDRPVYSRVVDEEGRDRGSIEGSIPRPFWDYMEVPLSEPHEQDINSRLGTQFELAYVLAMIAGMLNLLIAYDAFDGPAYGFDFAKEAEKKA